MLNTTVRFFLFVCVILFQSESIKAQSSNFKWPEGKQIAISLSFDDSRASQATAGIPLLDEYNVKGTFYVMPSVIKGQLERWKKAAANGHEIGNHSIHHPCTGNFAWSRKNALEDYTVEKMHEELSDANNQIFELIGVKAQAFAYPCGCTFIGRGKQTQSYVPVVADLFYTGRTWLDESSNDPEFCDFAQLTGMEMDGKDFEQILPMIDAAKKNGQWLILAGHEMGGDGPQTTRLSMLRKLIEYSKNPANGIWLTTVGDAAKYIEKTRGKAYGNRPALIRANEKAAYALHANTGKGVGPKIQYMPEWKAFGWFTGEDRVEWDVEVAKAGLYEVSLEWSVDDKEAGKPFVLEAGNQKLKGVVDKSGSWETFKKKNIGKIQLSAGKQTIAFRPDAGVGKGALLDLREVKLAPVK